MQSYLLPAKSNFCIPYLTILINSSEKTVMHSAFQNSLSSYEKVYGDFLASFRNSPQQIFCNH